MSIKSIGSGPHSVAPESAASQAADAQQVRAASVAQEALSPFPPELKRSHNKRSWTKIALVTPLLILLSPAVLVLGALVGSIRRLYELCDPKTRELSQKIDAMKTEVMSNQHKAMRKVARVFKRIFEKEPLKTNNKEYRKAIDSLITLILEDVKGGKKQERVQKVRRQLRMLLQSPEYKEHWKHNRRDDISFLQILAHGLKTGGSSGKAMQRVGQYLQEQYGRGNEQRSLVDFKAFAERLEMIYAKIPTFHQTHLNKILWCCAHPQKIMESLVGEGILPSWFGFHTEDYNSYEHGNLEQMAGIFELNNHKMAFFHGPGLGQDREIDCAFLEAQRKFGAMHWQHSLENTEHKGEKTRLDAQSSMAEHFNDTMVFSSSQFDGPAEKGFKIDAKAGDFIDQYYERLSDLLGLNDETASYHSMPKVNEKDNGFTFDSNIMSTDDISGAHQNAQQAMIEATKDNAHWKSLNTERKAKVLLASFEVFAKLKTLLTLMNKQTEQKELNTSSEACKQDIDRGIILNVLTQVCIALLQQQPLSSEQEDFLTGMTFSRSIMVDSRAILRKRFEAIPDFLKVVGQSKQSQDSFTQVLKDYLGTDANDLHFEIGG